MKTRILFTMILAVAVSCSLALSHGKGDAKTAAAKSCCMNGAKTADASKAASATMVLTGDKKAVAKSTEHCSEMTAKECEAMKASGKQECAMSGKTVKASAKMDCCKDTKAKTAQKKAAPEKSDTKGTN